MPSHIAFLHVDLNSPAAEVGVLEILFDRVVPGGMVVFDDYGWHIFHKQRLAEDRFMAERGHAILELPTGQGLVVKHEA
jgi:O-methyltransferase